MSAQGLIEPAPFHSSSRPGMEQARMKRLYAELAFAIGRTQASVLRQWGARSAGRLLKLAGRRVGALASLATRIGRTGATELSGLLHAWREAHVIW